MTLSKPQRRYRRDLLKSTGRAALALGVGAAAPRWAGAAPKTLKILQWNHFVPEYDKWFNETYVKEWGEKNDTRVIVDNVPMTNINNVAASEIEARRGHDLVMFLLPPSSLEDHVVDLREVHEECARRYGRPLDLATKSTYNPRTRKYYGFSDSYVPDPVNYRKDLWDDVGVVPNTWEDIRTGARLIKKKHGVPAGFGLAPELDTNVALRSLMATFGSSEQDAEGRLVLKSPETLETLKFVKALYKEAMTEEVFSWDASSNNRLMLAGRGSVTLNAISITRTGENQKIPITDRIWLSKAARGPVRQVGLQHLLDVYTIWNFADNIDGAKKFLIDFVGNSRKVFQASQFYNFPCYPQTVPDLQSLISSDPKGVPADKYKVFQDVTNWTINLGYPGYANAATDEIYNSWLISTMFAKCASGKLSPEAALDEANAMAREVFRKWQARGKV
ncbi:MAG: ABC transporter substrate-binding protein [Burkholderiaceae bacterium]|nr:ABC transporter substrate-binding protein [Burkholderiaceae bacterium]